MLNSLAAPAAGCSLVGISRLELTRCGLIAASVISQDERRVGEREMWREESVLKQRGWLVRFLTNQIMKKLRPSHNHAFMTF